MRWIDSVMFSHEPPSGVYRGMLPCANSHNTKLGVRWPLRLSSTSSSRKGGSTALRVIFTFRPACQRFQAARLSASDSTAAGGSAARTAANSCSSQPCNTTLVQLAMPLACTCPIAGWNNVSSLAVPCRTCSGG